MARTKEDFCSVIYDNVFPDNVDIDVLANMYREFYERHMPEMTYRVLNLQTTEIDDFYGETEVGARKYDDTTLHLIVDFTPEEQTFEKYGIDEKRGLLFTACRPLLEDSGVRPKIGDVIMFDGEPFEVYTVTRKPESYFAHSNYFFELILAADRPTVGN